jgi:hypothetical protein
MKETQKNKTKPKNQKQKHKRHRSLKPIPAVDRTPKAKKKPNHDFLRRP